MKYILYIVFAWCLSSTGALAQELVFSTDATESCLTRATTPGGQADCIGASANACMEATDGGFNTIGMGGCLDAELQYWNGRLNAAYRRAMASARTMDAEMANIGASAPKQDVALRAMQRAWIPFRDAKCDFARSQWGGGSGGGPAAVGCLMMTTADQTLYLEGAALGE